MNGTIIGGSSIIRAEDIAPVKPCAECRSTMTRDLETFIRLKDLDPKKLCGVVVTMRLANNSIISPFNSILFKQCCGYECCPGPGYEGGYQPGYSGWNSGRGIGLGYATLIMSFLLLAFCQLRFF